MANLNWPFPAQNSNKVGHRHQELQHVGGWSRGNHEECQGAVRPTYVVKISWYLLHEIEFFFDKTACFCYEVILGPLVDGSGKLR